MTFTCEKLKGQLDKWKVRRNKYNKENDAKNNVKPTTLDNKTLLPQ